MLLSAILEAFFWFLTWACSLFILHLWLLCLWLSHPLHTQSCFILVFFCLVLVVWCQLTVAFKNGAKTQKRDVYHEKQNLPGGYVHMEVNPIRLQSCSFWSGTFALQKHHFHCPSLLSGQEQVGALMVLWPWSPEMTWFYPVKSELCQKSTILPSSSFCISTFKFLKISSAFSPLLGCSSNLFLSKLKLAVQNIT